MIDTRRLATAASCSTQTTNLRMDGSRRVLEDGVDSLEHDRHVYRRVRVDSQPWSSSWSHDRTGVNWRIVPRRVGRRHPEARNLTSPCRPTRKAFCSNNLARHALYKDVSGLMTSELAEAFGGFRWEAIETEADDNLTELSTSWAAHIGAGPAVSRRGMTRCAPSCPRTVGRMS